MLRFDGDLIVAVGPNLSCQGREEIDATGQDRCPRLASMSTPIMTARRQTGIRKWPPSSLALPACTTVVMGNCGVGFAPARCRTSMTG